MGENKIDIFNGGYLKFIERWGSDESIIAAARMSTDGAFRGWGPKEDGSPGDEKLLGYLYRNKHVSPFEMAGLTIEVQAPIITFRQWHRHRTASYNELSARYTPMPDMSYMPTLERVLGQHHISTNKQAGSIKGAGAVDERKAQEFLDDLEVFYGKSEELYQKHLQAGIPKELARLFVSVGRYSRMRASANLRNWLGFLTLRMDGHAQHEIREFAIALGVFVQREFPRTWDLFMEGK